MSGDAPVDVAGGVVGIEAREEALLEIAAHCDAAGDRLRRLALRLGGVLADPDLVASATLAPGSFSRVATLLGEAAGPGVLGASLLLEADAEAVRGALACLAGADAVAEGWMARLDTGALLGAGALATITAPGWVPGVAEHPDAAGDLAESTLVAHPEIVDHLVRGTAGLPFWEFPLGALQVPLGAALVAGLYSRGHGRADSRPDLAAPTDVPHTVGDLTAHLAGVAALGTTSATTGLIEVQTLHTPDGVRHLVYLPGTDDMTTLPWQRDADARDMGANVELVGGRGTAYGDGVLAALQQAGVSPDDPVLLVGHSQGGILAGSIAAAGGEGYHVVGAITLGAPLATLPHLPDGVQVLALENSHDVVPHLDGYANPDEVGLVTVTADGGGTDVVGAHAFSAYAHVAAATDASDHPSVTTMLGQFGAEGFLGASAPATSQVFEISREP